MYYYNKPATHVPVCGFYSRGELSRRQAAYYVTLKDVVDLDIQNH